MHTLRREIFSAAEIKSMSLSFAIPSTGAAVTRTLSEAPCNPTISFFEARGCSLTVNRTPAAVFRAGSVLKPAGTSATR